MGSAIAQYQSWGNQPRAQRQHVRHVYWRGELADVMRSSAPVLPRGLGRSQGDSCLNEDGVLLDTTHLDRFVSFDRESGVLACEAGVTLADVLALAVPHGWFLPVTPGTKYVTVGGAIANDVHGKNHHGAGSFGHHVRSDGKAVTCSPQKQADLFAATVGGLGLTGVIAEAEIKLRRISSVLIEETITKLNNLDDFFALAPGADTKYDYTVAWIDCLATGRTLGRGLLLLGNHAADGAPNGLRVDRADFKPRFSLPAAAPGWVINRASVGVFNKLWYHKERRVRHEKTVGFNSFFYPLDGVGRWNLIYGARGFYQYQCVVPRDGGERVIRELLGEIADSGLASFLSTMKFFGNRPAAGMLSFPRDGITLAVDFANSGRSLLSLFERLDAAVMQAGGAIYPAKDGRMTGSVFRRSFVRWREFEEYVDPRFSSSFWRRVNDE